MDSSLVASSAVTTRQLESLNKTTPARDKRGDKGSVKSAVDSVNINMKEVYKSLTVLGREVVRKLDEILGDQLPGGIASLKPEEHTPEATADRIVSGVTSLLGVYAKQNPELEGEELIASFMSTVRGGVEEGYAQAASILGDIGAFEIDGVESGIGRTMELVEEKLQAFEEQFLKENSIDAEENVETSEAE